MRVKAQYGRWKICSKRRNTHDMESTADDRIVAVILHSVEWHRGRGLEMRWREMMGVRVQY